MAKMKWGNDVDWKGLNEAEYSDGDFADYTGEDPPKGTMLSGEVKKVWLAESANGNMMFKVVFEASGNVGAEKEYNGWGCWDNIVFTVPAAKFHWQPFFDALGITLKDVKLKTIVGEEDSTGTVVDSIGGVEFPAPIQVQTTVEKKGEYKGEARIGKWLPADDAELEDDEEDDEEDPF
jgi:hypothetical protein